jgi:hypothetical protein
MPKKIKGQKVYPGVKDLPQHIRVDFRNMFICLVIWDVINSEGPWLNPDLPLLQHTYNKVFPAYPARLQVGDAVSHPVSGSDHVTPFGCSTIFTRHLRRSALFVTVLGPLLYLLFNTISQKSFIRSDFKRSMPMQS